MKKKLLVGGVAAAAALLWPSGLGTATSLQAIDCPIGELATVCGAVDLVYSTACYQPLPEIPTIGFVTVDLEGGAPLVCPELPI